MIGIILPVYINNNNNDNKILLLKYFKECLESILKQTYRKWILIVIDDGSKCPELNEILSNTINTIDSNNSNSSNKDSSAEQRIIVLRNESNKGVTYSLNRAISEIPPECQYIARMDADDICHHERLERQYNYLNINKDIQVLGTNIVLFSDIQQDINNSINNNNNMKSKTIEEPNGIQMVTWSSFFNCCIVHPSVMFRREILSKYRYSDEKYKHCEDYTMWMEMIGNSDTVLDNLQGTPLLHLRKHGSSISKLNSQLQKESATNASLDCLTKLANKFNLNVDPLILNFKNLFALRYPATIDSPELIESCFNLLILIENITLKLFSNLNNDIIKESTDGRMGELIALILSKFPDSPQKSILWSRWLNRSPTSHIASLLSLMGNNNQPQTTTTTASSPISSITSILTGKTGNESTKKREDGIQIICFSKDRAFQLSEYLRTLYKYNTDFNDSNNRYPTKCFVLYTYSKEQYGESYKRVINQYPQVEFIKETDFNVQFRELVDKKLIYNYTVFGVDDILYYHPFSMKQLCQRLSRHPDAIGYFMKMSPQINYCHTANEQMTVPPFSYLSESVAKVDSSSSGGDYIIWNRLADGLAKRDWNYAWDMCSTIYRSSTVQHIVNSMIKYLGLKSGAISHPNRLEANGNRVIIQKQYERWPMCLSGTDPVMSVVTINRVQDIYQNPIYESSDTLTLEQLDELYNNVPPTEFNDEQYNQNRKQFNSCHIGNIYLNKI